MTTDTHCAYSFLCRNLSLQEFVLLRRNRKREGENRMSSRDGEVCLLGDHWCPLVAMFSTVQQAPFPVCSLFVEKGTSQPPAGIANAALGQLNNTLFTNTLHKLCAMKQASSICVQLLVNFRGDHNLLKVCGYPGPWVCPSSRILT